MFWGIHIKSTPKSSEPLAFEFSESVKLSQVALEPALPKKGVPTKTGTPVGKNKKIKTDLNSSQTNGYVDEQKQSPVTLLVEHDRKQFVLCTLDPNISWQCPLDLVFQAGSSVKFSLRGHGTIHLTGYEIPEEMDDSDDDMMASFQNEDDDLGEEDEDDKLNEKAVKKRLKELDRIKMEIQDEKADDDDDDDDDDDEDFDDSEDDDEDDDDDDDDGDLDLDMDDDEDEDEDEDDEEDEDDD